ncbi:MAG: hypothetical protein ABI566_13815, partial [Pseudolysinimonas sp.]
IMATHDVGIVDQMQRRVIELVSGQVVRDERGGSYQTQAVPIIQAQAPAARTAREESVLDDASLAAAPAPAPTPAPAATPTFAPKPAPEPAREPEPSPVLIDAPVTGTITIVEPTVVRPVTAPPVPKSAPHVVPRTDEPAPDLVPPPLNEPGRR